MTFRDAIRRGAALTLAAAAFAAPRAADADKNAFFRALNDKPVAEASWRFSLDRPRP